MIHINSLYLGELIQDVLLSDTTIVGYVSDRAFPIVANNGTIFPFIVYSRTNTANITNNKDGWYDNISFEVKACANTYVSSIELAQAIRNCFEHKTLSNNKLTIEDITLTDISEMYDEEMYKQTLTFSCTAM